VPWLAAGGRCQLASSGLEALKWLGMKGRLVHIGVFQAEPWPMGQRSRLLLYQDVH
jgi:hypothetical protein